MGTFESLRHVQKPVVDRSVGRSCVSESRGKHVSNLPIGAMGSFQGLCGTYYIILTEVFAVWQA
jgi:hypothetical protein